MSVLLKQSHIYTNIVNNLIQRNVIRFINHYSTTCSAIANHKVWTLPEGYSTSIKVFNPILKEKVDLILNRNQVATWYSCGPTVYDSAHIGHASCYVKFDIIRRTLEKWFDINVIMLMGITDIDDKIIKRANEVGANYKTISEKYETEFQRDMKSLNVMEATLIARVSDHIPHIIQFVEKIMKEGFAYVAPSGSVYFNTAAYDKYGKLVPVSSELNVNTSFEKDKQSPFDFALWKAVKPGEPFWNSPWGQGRPGWHIECSAMASEVFNQRIDIHTGGIDLKFPHHENEEAQSCTYYGIDQWVNYWLYAGHLNVKGEEKMSKSLKNTITIEDFLQTYTADQFRLLCIISPYRNSIEYSHDVMNNAVMICKRISSFLGTCNAYIIGQIEGGVVNEPELLQELKSTKEYVYQSICDDFHFSKAIASILTLITLTLSMINKESKVVIRSPLAVAAVSDFVKETLRRWGFSSVQERELSDNSNMLTNVLDVAVDFRSSVREIINLKKKDLSEDLKAERKELFQTCDKFRDGLNSLGIQLEDRGKKSSWRFIEYAKNNKDCVKQKVK